MFTVIKVMITVGLFVLRRDLSRLRRAGCEYYWNAVFGGVWYHGVEVLGVCRYGPGDDGTWSRGYVGIQI